MTDILDSLSPSILIDHLLESTELTQSALLEALPVAAWVKDLGLRYVWSNLFWLQLMQQQSNDFDNDKKQAIELIGCKDDSFLPGFLVEQLTKDDMQALVNSTEAQAEVEISWPSADGKDKMLRTYRRPIFDATGEMVGIAGFAVDVTEEVKTQKLLHNQAISQANWLHALQNHALITTMDRRGRFTYVSEQFGRLVGLHAADMTGQLRSEYELLPSGSQLSYYLTLAEQGNPVSFEYQGKRASGRPYWMRSLLIALNSPSETEQVFFELAYDLTAEKLATAELESSNAKLVQAVNENTQLISKLEVAARTDPLTSLINRRALFGRCEHEMARAIRNKTPICILMLDIDHFKKINDSYGHEAGDRALVCMAEWGLSCLRTVDMFARMGGEEFVILLPDTNIEDAAMVAERVRVCVEESVVPLPLQQSLSFTLSQGVTEFYVEQESFDTALARSDEALYQAKNNGRNRVVVKT